MYNFLLEIPCATIAALNQYKQRTGNILHLSICSENTESEKKLGTASESGLRRRGYLITGSIKPLQGPVVQDLTEYFLPVG